MITSCIRAATESDCDRIGAISAARSGRDPVEVADGARTFLKDRERDGKGLLMVAEVSGSVVGFARAQWLPAPRDAGSRATPEGWYLSGIVVNPEWRRHGFGHALTEARIVWLRERAEIAYYVSSASNRASIALHERFGFREVARNIVAPGVTFERGGGVLFSLDLRKAAGIRAQPMA